MYIFRELSQRFDVNKLFYTFAQNSCILNLLSVERKLRAKKNLCSTTYGQPFLSFNHLFR